MVQALGYQPVIVSIPYYDKDGDMQYALNRLHLEHSPWLRVLCCDGLTYPPSCEQKYIAAIEEHKQRLS